MEISEISLESQKKTYTSWLVKCTQEQKENLQKECAVSGKTVPEFLLDSIQGARLKDVFQGQQETQKEFVEMDKLIERLQQLIFAKMSIVLEKEKKAKETETFFQEKSRELEEATQQIKSTLEEDFALKEKELHEVWEENFAKEKQKFHEILGQKETHLHQSLEQNTKNKETLKKQEELIFNLETQLNQSIKNYNILENRLTEILSKQKNLEEKAYAFDKEVAKNALLENEVLKLQLRYESLEREEALKREYLEKDLRREFEMENYRQLQMKNTEPI